MNRNTQRGLKVRGAKTSRNRHPWHRWLQKLQFLGCLVSFASATAFAAAQFPIVEDPPPAPMLEETESFMGMPIDATIRVKCSAPKMEINNARLLAVTSSNITIATANGERFTLPKETTMVESAVAWQRTSTIMGGEPRRSGRGGGGFLLILLLLACVGAAGWIWHNRRSEAGTETIKDHRPGARPERASGKITLSPPVMRAAAPEVVATPSGALPQTPESDGDVIEDLIKSRCYGTALEKLNQQIKLQPDEFKRQLQLLRVYVALGDGKQVDRVWHQIQSHPGFTAEEKEQAGQAVPVSQRK